MKKLYSWVPTVSGRLSYSHMGEDAFPRHCTHLNQIGRSQDGQAIFYQVRYCDDFVIPFFGKWDVVRNGIVNIFKWFRKPLRHKKLSGRHIFVATVEKVEMQDQMLDRITGKIYPMRAYEPKMGKTTEQISKDVRDQIISGMRLNENAKKNHLKELVNVTNRSLSPVCPLVLEFNISRNGIAEISYANPSLDEREARDYAEQGFFFLRDISHVHQHHDPRTDTIVRVHDEGVSFYRDIYFDLFRYIVRFKRRKSPKNIIRASGLLAYASSFRQIAEGKDCFPNDYQIDNLKISLDSAQFELDFKAQKSISTITFYLTMIFTVFGLLLSLTSLTQFGTDAQKRLVQPSDFAIGFTQLIAANPFLSFLIVAGTIFIGMLVFGKIVPNTYSWFQNLQRLLNHRPRASTFTILFVSGAILTFLGLSMLKIP